MWPLGLTIVVLLLVSLSMSGQADQAVREAKAAGVPTELEDLPSKNLSPEQNAAVELRELVSMKDTVSYTNFRDGREALDRFLRFDPTYSETDLHLYLEESEPLIDLMVKAASKADCDFERDWTKSFGPILPEHDAIRQLDLRLLGRMKLRAIDGDLDGVIEDLEAYVKLSEHFSDQDGAMGWETWSSLRGGWTWSAIRTLSLTDGDAELREGIKQQIEQHPLEFDLWNSLKLQAYLGSQLIDDPFKASKSAPFYHYDFDLYPPDLYDRTEMLFLRSSPVRSASKVELYLHYKTVFDTYREHKNDWSAFFVALEPEWERIEGLHGEVISLSGRVASFTTNNCELPVWNLKRFAERHQAVLTILRSIIALYEVRDAEGEFPETLPSGLDSTDPYNTYGEGTLRYGKYGDGFYIYSVGSNSIDDTHNDPSEGIENDDIGFVFPIKWEKWP